MWLLLHILVTIMKFGIIILVFFYFSMKVIQNPKFCICDYEENTSL